MPEYINHNQYPVHLPGPDGKTIRLRSQERRTLSEFYERYRARGFITLMTEDVVNSHLVSNIPKPKLTISPKKTITSKISQLIQPPPTNVYNKQSKPATPHNTVVTQRAVLKRPGTESAALPIHPVKSHRKTTAQMVKQVVGRVVNKNTSHALGDNIDYKLYPISNNIGVGILSFNRHRPLRRLINSIIKHTNLLRTTLFISDDCSTDPETLDYLNELSDHPDIIILRNTTNLGVAGNSNRLLRCLSRFKYGILLNDDAEVLRPGWDNFYFDAMRSTGLQHLIYRQVGVYNAGVGESVDINGVILNVVQERPHGAILAFSNLMLQEVGYFDTIYGNYGLEHVDWSSKAYEFGLQPTGYHDVRGSETFFKIHNEPSAVINKHESLNKARKIFETRSPTKISVNPESDVPEISYVIPFRNQDRIDSILTVVNSIRAQRFPAIDIILAEQDLTSNITFDELLPIRHYLVDKQATSLFNKSLAFNVGVSHVITKDVVLHDADMLLQSNYTSSIYDTLRTKQSCHLGNTVVYATKQATEVINSKQALSPDMQCERIVGYYEGGSLACTVEAYWSVGAFNEDFKGYGCFLPGHYVLTQAGYKLIQDVTTNDQLYTHQKRFKPIELRRRHYSGPILDIYVPGRLPIKGITPEHPFLVYTGPDELMWRKACDLKKGDRIAQTDDLPDLIGDFDFAEILRLDRSKNQFDVTQYMGEFCYLLGLYLAEGVIQSPKKLRIVYFYLNKGEMFLVEHVEELLRQLNPDINMTYHYIKNNCREVRVFNSLLAKLIFAVAGKFSATEKTLSPNFIRSRSDAELGLLLGGGCDGDANHNLGSEQRLVYHTSSINLAMTYSGIMRRLGIAHSFGKRAGGSFEGSSEFGFDLCVNREFEHLISSQYPRPPVIGSNSTGKSQFGLIYDIKTRTYDGPVFNFEVEEDHSYVVQGLVVHNCEDCDFYARLSGGSNWSEDRTFDLVHLWHPRSDGWNAHHEANRALEATLKIQEMPVRIHQQLAKLRLAGYGKYLK